MKIKRTSYTPLPPTEAKYGLLFIGFLVLIVAAFALAPIKADIEIQGAVDSIVFLPGWEENTTVYLNGTEAEFTVRFEMPTYLYLNMYRWWME